MNKKKLFSIILTFAIVGLLILSGPTQAVQMSINTQKDVYSLKNQVIFTMEINIENSERVPLQNLNLHITHNNNDIKKCLFNLTGDPISGCSNIEITPLAIGQRGSLGFGNNLGTGFGNNGSGLETATTNFGYGYGYNQGKLKYEIKWRLKDENNLEEGAYEANLEAFAKLDNKEFTYLTKDKASFIIGKNKENGKPKNGNFEITDPNMNKILQKIEGLNDGWNITSIVFGDELPGEWNVKNPNIKTNFNFFEINVNEDTTNGNYNIFFSILKSELGGISPNDIKLYVYEDNEWAGLPTTIIDSTTDPIQFSAKATHFSKFLIGEKESPSTTNQGNSGGGSSGGNFILTSPTVLTSVPFAYPDCRTDSDCRDGNVCKNTRTSYYKQCVPKEQQFIIRNKQNIPAKTSEPQLRDKITGLSTSDQTIKSNPLISIIVALIVLGLIIGTILFINLKKPKNPPYVQTF